MKKIKVAQIITRMDWAGSPDIVRMICRALAQDNYEITLISGPTKFPSSQTKKFFQEFSGRLIIVPSLKRNINPFFDFFAFLHLYFILAKEKFDLVQTHTAKAGALGRIAGYLAGNRRIIHMPHGHNFYGYFNPILSRLIIWIERFLSRFTTKFLALSELEKSDLIKFRVAKAEKVVLVPSGLDLEFKNMSRDIALEKKMEFGFTAQEKIIGMVSRLEPVKGGLYFVQAARELQKKYPDLRFILVGEGSQRHKLEKRTGELGLKDKIIFSGWREDVLAIISFLDILVQPSLNEAIGRVLLEAQGLGVPVVATRVGGIPEVVKDGVSGILVPPANTTALVKAISHLLDSQAERLLMSQRAKVWVDEKFSSQKMLEAIALLYQEVILK